jgi:hypothetical protein
MRQWASATGTGPRVRLHSFYKRSSIPSGEQPWRENEGAGEPPHQL